MCQRKLEQQFLRSLSLLSWLRIHLQCRRPGSVPGLGKSTGEGKGYPLQYSWIFLVIQLVKNLPAMQETWIGSLGWEDPLEKGKATHSSILAWRIPWTTVHGVTKSQTPLSNFHFLWSPAFNFILHCHFPY